MLLLHMSEEEAFWTLSAICEEIVPGYYSSRLSGVLLDIRVLETLLNDQLPEIAVHLRELGLALRMLVLPWFMCLFINCLPWPATLRILDWFFMDGPIALFNSSLAVLELRSEQILECQDTVEVFQLVKKCDLDADELIETALSFEVDQQTINRLREMHADAVVAQIRANDHRLSVKPKRRAVAHRTLRRIASDGDLQAAAQTNPHAPPLPPPMRPPVVATPPRIRHIRQHSEFLRTFGPTYPDPSRIAPSPPPPISPPPLFSMSP
jgi:hypothetical protein